MRRMYDSTNARDIPRNAGMVAGYLPPSSFAWSASDWALFPQATKVQIAVRASTNGGHVLDVERGDATPVESVDWALRRRAAGQIPTVYCSELDQSYGWPAVRRAFQARGVPEPLYWIAHYDGRQTIPAGAVAKQYANQPLTGGHWDESIVVDFWPGVDGDGMATLDDVMHTLNGISYRIERMDVEEHDLNQDGHPEADPWRVARDLRQRISGLDTRLSSVETKLDQVLALVSAGFTLTPSGSITVTAQPR